MKKAPRPDNEKERSKVVKKLGVLDTAPEERFDAITREATEKLKTPISIVTIIDGEREWYKSCQGINVKEGSRDTSFCGHAMLAEKIFIVEDTLKDDRFKDNPQVTSEPHIRFYAGVSLHDLGTGLPVGVFCIKDNKPRTLNVGEINTLLDLASKAEAELSKPLQK